METETTAVQSQGGVNYIDVIARMGLELGNAAARIYLLDAENAALKAALAAKNGLASP